MGHYFGPDSAELMDITLRTDRLLADFLDRLGARVGLENCLIALTADHGVTSSPYVSKSMGLEVDFVDPRAIVEDLNRKLRELLGDRAPAQPLVVGFDLPFMYCDPRFDELDQETGGKLTDLVLEHVHSLDGIQDVFTAEELLGPPPPPEDKERYLSWRCFHPERSGQFCVRLSPYWYKVSGNIAGHTPGFDSDRHVPILFLGPGVQAGSHTTQVDPLDIAPTLARLLGIRPPAGCVGRVLSEAIDRSLRVTAE